VVSGRLGRVPRIWIPGTIVIVRRGGRLVDHCRTGIRRTGIAGRVRATVHLRITTSSIISGSSVVPVRTFSVKLRRHLDSFRWGGVAAPRTYPGNRRTSPHELTCRATE